ncbi:uncharacterized protein ATNIH1004_007952 [Aspergillus tanneri]|uniref:alpha-glucosidase n=1 Tax=Aspergillus tanneri TaxID=1220188 RepID=A0A5M9MPP8_9EURO|nr:uncharacterized protein ATNIH1004_007952 [Aspergillus tanneri]KAA8646519.1 hypothetical protein ATNIH1004_007952 [Aspergillus tanneri]
MGSVSRTSMLTRRPSKRPMVITGSTIAGAGVHVGHWLGDNASLWSKYRLNRPHAQLHIYLPNSHATPQTLCARWATLGAFYPLHRNNTHEDSIPQEFYRWLSDAEAARSSTFSEPVLSPLFYIYPEDTYIYPIDLQFFYGDAILVSPVTKENSTSVDIYPPDHIFYDWYTGAQVRWRGETYASDVAFTDIPLHIRGGSIIPLRTERAPTAPPSSAKSPSMWSSHQVGTELLPDACTWTTANHSNRHQLWRSSLRGHFAYDASVKVETLTILGQNGQPQRMSTGSVAEVKHEYDGKLKVLTLQVDLPLTSSAEVIFL